MLMRGTKKKIRFYHRFILTALLLWYAGICLHVYGQNVSVKTWFDSDTILIGDQIHYNIELFQPGNLAVSFPEFNDTLTNSHLEILEKSARDTLATGKDILRITQQYLITCFDSGAYTVPAQQFVYGTADKKMALLSQPAYLQVLTMPLDTSQAIFDIKEPYRAPITFQEIMPYLLGLIILVGFIILILRFLRNKKHKQAGFSPAHPPEPPHVTALRELDRLKEAKLWQNNRIKLYYSRLTDILRTYLEGRYGIAAMESTSNEILREIKRTGFNDNRLFIKLKDLLQLADLVKFAKVKPEPGENETALLDTYIFVNETKQVEKLIPDESKPPDETSGEEPTAEIMPGEQKKDTGSIEEVVS